MRTTLTLEDDVAAALRAMTRERRLPWKEVVNEVLRRGLASSVNDEQPAYQTPSHPAGELLMPADLQSLDDMVAWAEGEGAP